MSNDNKPAAAQEAVAWTKTKPTVEGAHNVRGFAIGQGEALVQVRMHRFDGEPAPELVCNIHESTSNEDMDDWWPMVDLSDDFEWLGPLVAAPVAAAPVEQSPTNPIGCDSCPVTGLPFYDNMDHPERGMIAMYGGPFDVYSIPELDADGELRRERFDLDRDDWVEGGEPLGYFYNEQQPEAVSTPAAPGIDLVDRIAMALHANGADSLTSDTPWSDLNSGELMQFRSWARAALAAFDASPKGGSDAVLVPVADLKALLNPSEQRDAGAWDRVDAIVQATSAEVGS